MIFPLGWTGPLSGIVCGVLFGWVLQRGGLGNGCRLTAGLRFQDSTVFNVMASAVLVTAVGMYVLELAGLLQIADVFVPTTFFWATLLGGALIGAGMGLGGYCPGTSVVGAAGGRIDGLVFFIGLIVGVVAFAGVYTPITPLLTAAAGPQAQTLDTLLGIPAWLILAIMAGAIGGVWWFTRHGRANPSITCAD